MNPTLNKYYKLISLLLFILLAPLARSQNSLQALHTRIPASPANAAAAPAWLNSAAVTTLRKQLQEQRAFVEKLSRQAGESSMAATSTRTVDFARAQRDPAYAQELQKKLASMSQAEQMKFALEMQQATQAAALEDVQAMAADPEAVTLAAGQYSDYQMKQASGGIAAQVEAVGTRQRQVSDLAYRIGERVTRQMKCSDGEGSCSAADAAGDKAKLRAAHAEILAEYDRALLDIAKQVQAARQARAADIAHAQKYLAPAQYGAAARSNANRQLLAAYHNAVLMEVEQLFTLAEDTAKWAALRVQDRSINFMPID